VVSTVVLVVGVVRFVGGDGAVVVVAVVGLAAHTFRLDPAQVKRPESSAAFCKLGLRLPDANSVLAMSVPTRAKTATVPATIRHAR
jgi:ABC-type Zn uptake system ZnuABC Zn-binding protein ZnuA